MTTLRTIVFDLGNVLIEWDPRRVWTDLDERQVSTFLQEADFASLNRAMDAGGALPDVRAQLEARAPHHLETFDAYWAGYERSLVGPVPGSAELVKELQQAGYRLLGLTNWSADTFHHAAPAAPAIALLEDILVSGREGLAKPDPAIYELLVRRFDLVPEQTYFIDDSLVNVEAARAVGLHAHHFTGTEGLREDLRRHGVDPGARDRS